MNHENVNIDELKTWIGNSEVVIDEISQSLEKRFRATLDLDPGEPVKGDRASSGIHWLLLLSDLHCLEKIHIQKKEASCLLFLYLEECGQDVKLSFYLHYVLVT